MSVQSVQRTFSIIEYLSADSKPQVLASIAKACGLAPATAHRLLETLRELGYVKSEPGGYYLLTPKLFSLTSNAVTNSSLIAIARPHLEDLSSRVNESVHLVLREGCDVLYVYKVVKSLGSIQMASHIGMRIPMYRTATGKSIMSTLSQEEVRQIFLDSDVRPVTPNTITTMDELLQSVEMAKKLGYSTDKEENELGITCIAMPLGKDGTGAKYAFSISSLSSRMSEERLLALAEEMRVTQKNILGELVSV